MKLPPWLPPCSSTTTTATPLPKPPPPPPPKLLLSDDTSSTISAATSPSLDTSYSLHSSLSLQTLPSLPSLQTLSPDTLHLSVTHRRLPSLATAAHVHSLLLHHHLLYAAAGHLVHVFDTTSSTLLHTFNTTATGAIKAVAFLDGKIFTAHQDSKIRAWKSAENKPYKHFSTLPTFEDKMLRWVFPKNYVDVRRHRRRLWIEHHDAVTGLSRIDKELMCSVSWDKYLKFWNTKSLRCLESVKAHDDAINAVAVAADGVIYTGSADRRIKAWARTSGKRKYGLIATLEKHKSAVNALALAAAGSVLFSGACDRSILVWEREDSANHMVVAGALRGHSKAILCLVTVSDDLLVSGSADRTVRVWQRGPEGKFCCLTVLDGHQQPVRSLAAKSDTSGSVIKVFSGSFDGQIKAWEIQVSNTKGPVLKL